MQIVLTQAPINLLFGVVTVVVDNDVVVVVVAVVAATATAVAVAAATSAAVVVVAVVFVSWRGSFSWFVCLLVGCFTSQQQARVSQGRIYLDNFTCCHTEIEVADQTFYLTQSQHTDTGPTSPSADPITPGAWQGSHWSANFEVTGMTRPRKKSRRKRDSNPGPSALEVDALLNH